MCYIMITKRIGKPSSEIEKQIRGILLEKMDRNDDGYFFSNGPEIIRTMDDRIAKQIIKTAQLNNLLVHFRMASAGHIIEDNIHGWKIGDWIFFHNGGIATYTNYQARDEQKYADSYLFFQDLWFLLEEKKGNLKDKNVIKSIETILKKVSFWGRAALYNVTTDRMFLFGDFETYHIGNYILFSSSKLDFDQKCESKIKGIKFDYSQLINIGEYQTKGITIIYNFSKDIFQFKQLTEKLPTKEWDNHWRFNVDNKKDKKEEKEEKEPTFDFSNNWKRSTQEILIKTDVKQLPASHQLDSHELDSDKEEILEKV